MQEVIHSGVVFNITMQVEDPLLTPWLLWMREEFTPAMMQTGCFVKQQVLQLMYTAGEPTFAIQFYCDTVHDYQVFEEIHQDGLLKKISDKWNSRIIFFTTSMKIVN